MAGSLGVSVHLAHVGSLINGRYYYASQLSLLSEVCGGLEFFMVVVDFSLLSLWSFLLFCS